MVWPYSKFRELEEKLSKSEKEKMCLIRKNAELTAQLGGRRAIDELEFLRGVVGKFAQVTYRSRSEGWVAQYHYKIKRTLKEAEQDIKYLQLYIRVLEGKLLPHEVSSANNEYKALKDLIPKSDTEVR